MPLHKHRFSFHFVRHVCSFLFSFNHFSLLVFFFFFFSTKKYYAPSTLYPCFSSLLYTLSFFLFSSFPPGLYFCSFIPPFSSVTAIAFIFPLPFSLFPPPHVANKKKAAKTIFIPFRTY